MKYLLILSCLLFTSVGWSKDVSMDDLVQRDGLYYEKNSDVPFTGNILWYAYKDKNIITIKVSYKDGKREGEYLEYYENGQLRFKRNYKDGKLEGEYLIYYESGQLKKKNNYKNGKRDGENIHYWENGQLYKTEIYKDGELIETIKP
ncbi:MAG: hypothetical protein CMC04_01855 [Flavobacteriaceae bacterium]|nr:hypothetical protein [Flavobacteriaceae bacterium]|tara:strand:+ start:11122 stop:11562 length:441 start_codon:yes stop_codon:yes gene_type:complete